MRTFARHRWWLLTLLLTAPIVAVAAGVPHVFTAGDVISSAQVNDNFKDLADRVTALEAGPRPNPWVKAGDNVSKAAWDELVAKYPLDKYEWGTDYNGIGGQIHRVTFSKWNRGIRIMTEEYIEGDADALDPPGNLWIGGAAWVWDTVGAFDNACTQAGSFKHLYWQRSAAGVTFLPGNGCNGGAWWVRLW
jgi:hypothetical protein